MTDAAPEGAEHDARYGPVRVIGGARGGRYPQGNSLLVEGERETIVIDPSLGVIARKSELPPVDRVINSHCHEDHIAGNHLFPDVPWHVHTLDRPGFADLDGMMAIYGYGGAIEEAFRKVVVDQFRFRARPDAIAFEDGETFDLGGVTITVHHTPGHTRGHCCLAIEWREGARARRLIYLGDIELTSFGPYYGDAWSDLEDFERSLARVRQMRADWYATFHHIGVLAGREAFLARLEIFEAKIGEREQRLLAFLAEPRSLDDVIAHRFVYRPHDPVPFADCVERRSMGMHIDRLLRDGKVEEVGGGRYRAR